MPPPPVDKPATDWLQERVEALHAYVDSMVVWIVGGLVPADIAFLASESGSSHVEARRCPNFAGVRTSASAHRAIIHQPSRAALEHLCIVAHRTDVRVNSVDFALDFLAHDFVAANQVLRFFDSHLIQRWHGRDTVKRIDGTRYTRRRRNAQRQLVMYAGARAADKHGRPACHLELRLAGLRQVRARGVHAPSDLLSLDHWRLWDDFLVLEEPRWEVVGRQFLGRSKAKRPASLVRRASSRGGQAGRIRWRVDLDSRVAGMIRRGASTSEQGATAQDLRDDLRGCSWFRPKSAMTRLAVSLGDFERRLGVPSGRRRGTTDPALVQVESGGERMGGECAIWV